MTTSLPVAEFVHTLTQKFVFLTTPCAFSPFFVYLPPSFPAIVVASTLECCSDIRPVYRYSNILLLIVSLYAGIRSV